MISTISICPVCYSKIPAIITVDKYVVMEKYCDKHGIFEGIVETDPLWFAFCRELNCKSLYDGYILDITNRCNINCKYCYHDNTGIDRTVESIVSEAEKVKHLAPFILSGGEPTLHPELLKIISKLSKFGETSFLTNGTKLCNEKYLNQLIKVGILTEDTFRIGLSLHKESNGKDIQFLKLCKRRGFKIASTLFVIDNVSQISEALEIYKEFKDVILCMRIKVATCVWVEDKPKRIIYVSEMLKYLESLGKVKILTKEYNNKVSFSHVEFDGLHLILGSWYDVSNIDLEDNEHPPWYKANDGNVYSLTTAFMVNKRLSLEEKYAN